MGVIEASFNRALSLHQQGQLAQAEAIYREILKLQPRHSHALHLLGVVAFQAGNYKAAIGLIARAIAVNPGNPAFFSNHGNALQKLGELEAAVTNYDKAIALKPDYAEAHYNRGNALHGLGRHEAALASYDRAVALDSRDAESYRSRGVTLQALKRRDAAAEDFNKAIALDPGNAEAHCNLANLLQETGQLDAALTHYGQALSCKPEFVAAWSNRGNVLQELAQLDAAIASYDRAIELAPGHAEAHAGRGETLQRQGRLEAAAASYQQACALKPEYPFLPGILLHTKMRLCDWSSLEQDLAGLRRRLALGEPVTPSFPLLALDTTAVEHRLAAELWAQAKYSPDNALGPLPAHQPGERIRLGYFSADFHDHATAFLIAGLFECHDRGRFEVIAFSFGPERDDAMRRRLTSAFDQFIDVRAQTDAEIAQLARSMGIDIAIDLKGFTQDQRSGIFARRAAPVQVSYLGYPGTMGCDFIDYLIADSTVLPEQDQQYYAEQIAYLPGSYQVNDASRAVPGEPGSRSGLGLPESGFVFCCFNNNYKITPQQLDSWARILDQVPGSVLWLLEDNPVASRNLRREAQSRGLAPERLVFAPRAELPEHLARQRAADLFLDTLPYNAHTTASDALWTGLPVLTCSGASFAGRVAASLLGAVGMPELIADSPAHYEQLAVELATDNARLRTLQARLVANRATAPLFDTRLFAHNIEAAYAHMLERQQSGLQPATFHV
ncbi:tetratricopeptide repeat protein [Kineobactrum salinum]|uniref:protein O-GlcNAc transferase n=1 Tax=Kineobactrum salinum TaxID=2708301 RepID=A0A6C0U456_9GAMM|nr:tetratricopeptide repeat protein [Kineobactrum salinum]QIB66930.1 tetratricopeptide repeat protein [Kineobactrum salinum]